MSARILAISDGRGNLVPNAWPMIYATMLFPLDSQARIDYCVAIVSRALIERGSRDARLKQPAQSAWRWDEAGQRRHHEAWVAGELLTSVLGLAIHSRAEATINRAIYLHGRAWRGKRDSLGRKLPTSARWLWAIWGTYKSIAPLRAAWTSMRECGAVIGPEGRPNDLLGLLSASHSLTKAAASWCPPIGRPGRTTRGGLPLLDPALVWRAPPDLVLPPVPLGVGPLPDAARLELRNFNKTP